MKPAMTLEEMNESLQQEKMDRLSEIEERTPSQLKENVSIFLDLICRNIFYI